jgi:hypothetical protein
MPGNIAGHLYGELFSAIKQIEAGEEPSSVQSKTE